MLRRTTIFTDGMLAVYQDQAIPVLKKILYHFDSCMTQYGISTVAEITDGDPPYKVDELIRSEVNWSVIS